AIPCRSTRRYAGCSTSSGSTRPITSADGRATGGTSMGDRTNSSRISRRDLLRLGGSGLGLAALGSMLKLTTEKSALGAPMPGLKRLVVVNLQGGNDGLNTLVPVTLTRYYDRRPTIAVPAVEALSLAGGPGTQSYGLHPQLDQLQALWNESRVAFV